MRQVLSIHGGGEFIGLSDDMFLKELAARDVSLERIRQKHSWKGGLSETLGEGYDVLAPHMPRKDTPRYAEWKLWFEKIVPLLDDTVILLGHSLGGLFLIKYLAEERFPKKSAGLLVVAAPFVAPDEEPYRAAGFELPDGLLKVAEQAPNIFFYHSTDDPVVPFTDLAKYRERLPKSTFRVFDDRKHFNGKTFPELVADIHSIT